MKYDVGVKQGRRSGTVAEVGAKKLCKECLKNGSKNKC